MSIWKYFVLAAMFLLLPIENLKAQDNWGLAVPAESLRALKQKSDAPDVYKALGEISEDWTFIEYSFGKVGSPTDKYKEIMDYNRKLLNEAAMQANSGDAAKLVYDVKEDLAVKAGYIRTVPIASAAAYSEVSVVVKTMKNQQEVHGYFIGFSPKYLSGQDPVYRFSNPTSPSEGSLPPGRYEMVAILNGTIIARQEVNIGVKGGQDQSTTCLITQ
jgi:hypothetical protein